MKNLFYLPILLLMIIPCNLRAQKSTKGKTTKSNSKRVTPGDQELEKFRQENPVYFKNHIEGLASSAGSTGIDYSNFNGKNCSEIAKKENWGNWNPPVDAEKRCEKFLKMKKVKKVMFYPIVK